MTYNFTIEIVKPSPLPPAVTAAREFIASGRIDALLAAPSRDRWEALCSDADGRPLIEVRFRQYSKNTIIIPPKAWVVLVLATAFPSLDGIEPSIVLNPNAGPAQGGGKTYAKFGPVLVSRALFDFPDELMADPVGNPLKLLPENYNPAPATKPTSKGRSAFVDLAVDLFKRGTMAGTTPFWDYVEEDGETPFTVGTYRDLIKGAFDLWDETPGMIDMARRIENKLADLAETEKARSRQVEPA